MVDKYDEIFEAYKNFIKSRSQYDVEVVKYNTNTSTYFPLISFELSNRIDTDTKTYKNIDNYEKYYFTINQYTKAKKVGGKMIAPQVIDKELEQLTIEFLHKLNMKITADKPTMNLDTSIFKRTIQAQGEINGRYNIIRR
jgi:hypothetical protein